MLKELTRKPTRGFETDCAKQGMIDHVAKANQLGLPHAEYFNALFAEGGDSMQDVDRVAEFLWTLLHLVQLSDHMRNTTTLVMKFESNHP